MADRLTAAERAAIDRWLAEHRPTRCPPAAAAGAYPERTIAGHFDAQMLRIAWLASLAHFRIAEAALYGRAAR